MNSKLTTVFRIILGLILLIFGADKFFNFMPVMELEGSAGNFMSALISTAYLFQFIGITEMLSGILLILNKWTGLALILASVIIVNILAFHVFLAPLGIGPGALMAVLAILLYYSKWNKFKPLF